MNLTILSRILPQRNLLKSAVDSSRYSLIDCSRSIWAWLNPVWNRVDKSRIKEVGPDRAAAEWLLRCGAYIKWQNFEKWHTDYNMLPTTNDKYKIEEIDATDSCIMNIGFQHLQGLKNVRRMVLHKCSYLDDTALDKLTYVADTLEHLQVTSCGNITDSGIIALRQLMNLKTLNLYDLPEVRDRFKCIGILEASLPNCSITFKTVEEVEKSKKEVKQVETKLKKKAKEFEAKSKAKLVAKEKEKNVKK